MSNPTNAAAIPLPSDDELTPMTRKVLANLPPANLFRMLANAPASLSGFVQLAGSILLQSQLDAKKREVAVLRTAHVTRSRYEWEQHVHIARRVRLSDDVIDRLASDGPVEADEETGLLCRVAEEIARDVRLSDDALARIVALYGKRQATELVLCCAYFNMVSRFLESTRVELDADMQSLHSSQY